MTSSLISVEDARERVLRVTPQLETEVVAVEQAYGRVLREDVRAAADVPPFACSAMDGYATSPGPAHRTLKVVGESRAGAPSERAPGTDETIRISTGAAVPEAAEAVIRQEDVAERGELIETTAELAPGANIRRAGEDMRAGATVLSSGSVLRAAELGAAVAAGAGELSVSRRPRATVLTTGDELRAPGEQLGPGQIHNSNAVTLSALARRCGAEVAGAETLRDDPETTRSVLANALAASDLVIVSGGVSVGPHDHVKPALAALDVVEQFWGVALQPGKPTWFGSRGEQLVFGLPGNPVSAVVTFTLFAAPALAALQGARIIAPPFARTAELGVSVRRNPHRQQAVRVRLESEDGRIVAIPNGPQGSHIVTSLLGAQALALIPAGEGELVPGTTVALVVLPD